MPPEPPELIVDHAAAWGRWLDEHGEGSPAGVWLVLAKKGTVRPTRLSYDEALEESLCHGWIDGQVGRRDGETYRQRFTPRRPRSVWSARNVRIAESLIAAGRMRPAGLAQVQVARADGRWADAYPGAAEAEIPEDLAAALAARPRAREMFELLSGQNRYAILYRLATARRPETRRRNLEKFLDMLERGETPHPQRRKLE